MRRGLVGDALQRVLDLGQVRGQLVDDAPGLDDHQPDRVGLGRDLLPVAGEGRRGRALPGRVADDLAHLLVQGGDHVLDLGDVSVERAGERGQTVDVAAHPLVGERRQRREGLRRQSSGGGHCASFS